MAIQDSNSERRNLTLTSLAFIAFFWGGGTVEQSTIQLQVINVTFDRPGVLACLAWSALFWFVYRYWLINSGNFSKELSREIHYWREAQFIQPYLQSQLKEPVLIFPGNRGWEVQELRFRNLTLECDCVFKHDVEWQINNGIVTAHARRERPLPYSIQFEGFRGRLSTVCLLFSCFFVRPSFSSYVAPYLLFVLAVVSGVVGIAL